MRIIILGATGFLGGQIARAAHELGHEVHGLRRNPASFGAVGDLPVEWHQGDLNDPASLIDALRGSEVVYHAAAYYPYRDHHPARAVAQAKAEIQSVLQSARAAGVRRLVYASSLTTIGALPTGENRLADERDPYIPGSTGNAYFEAKWIMEREVLEANGHDLETLALIPTAIFGPGDIKPTTGEILLELARGRMPVGVDIVTNFVDGRDVALACLRAAEMGQPGQRYLIGGHNMSATDMLREAAQAAGVKLPRWALSRRATLRLFGLAAALRLPIPELMRGIAHFQPLECSRGWQTFSFQPRPFAETARDTIDWFRQNGYV